ncbi:MAG: LytTR family DNA-binding domain-containing protein [Agriterribacter sp.]
MIKAIIIDDEKNNIDNLEGLLQKYCPQVIIAASALNAEEATAMIALHKPELLFLDIQMPGKNGLELLQSLPVHTFEVIFVTAFDQYGIQAVKFSALDYLLKPVNIDELKTAVQKADERIQQKRQNIPLENLLQLLEHRQQKEEHRLALSTLKETRLVKPSEIIRCESSNAYTTFFLDDEQKLLISRPIYEYEELLKEYGFMRCHQSHLVNKKYIRSWVKEDGGYLLLHNGNRIPVSRNKKEFIIQHLKL